MNYVSVLEVQNYTTPFNQEHTELIAPDIHDYDFALFLHFNTDSEKESTLVLYFVPNPGLFNHSKL